MDDAQLLRYARHILLDELGIEGQQKLLDARVLIVGAGGLGSPAAMYLAAAWVGHIVLADDDVVDVGNLQRQIMHQTAALDQPKVLSGQRAMQAINPEVNVTAMAQRLEGDALLDTIASVDLVLDCCDNFRTRHAVNRACVQHRKPLVSGAAIRFSGQVSVFDLRQIDNPCYHCLFPEADDAEELRCATTGVLGPLVGIIGSVQATEAIKIITGMGEPLVGRLQSLDALSMRWHEIRYRKDPGCEVCANPVQAAVA